jgi:glutamyl-tRNA synthetase
MQVPLNLNFQQQTGQSSGRTRYAPTPSGFLHRGNLYSFELTHRIARESGRQILLRIDDLDRERLRPEYVRDIFNSLKRASLDWDLGPATAEEFEDSYSQRHRLPLYEKALELLRSKNAVYACACSRSPSSGSLCRQNCAERSFDLDKAQHAWRFRTSGESEGLPLWSEGIAVYPWPEALKDPVVRRKDGLPAYHLASVVDDLFYDIDLIVRGMDLLESSLFHRVLARALGEPKFERIRFVHHPLILNAQGVKLSKTGRS